VFSVQSKQSSFSTPDHASLDSASAGLKEQHQVYNGRNEQTKPSFPKGFFLFNYFSPH